VRNPLGVIRSSAAMVREHFGPADDAHRACGFILDEIDRLEALLADGRPWLAGDAFGLADISVSFPVAFAAFFGVPPTPSHPQLAAWLARARARPSVARETARMMEAVRSVPA